MEASNLQELKDAATELMRFTCNSCERRFCEEDAEEEDGRSVPSLCGAIIRMRNALSANPIRNCDVGSPEEQFERWWAFCGQFDEDCTGCPYGGCNRTMAYCFAKWGQMPYETQKRGAK